VGGGHALRLGRPQLCGGTPPPPAELRTDHGLLNHPSFLYFFISFLCFIISLERCRCWMDSFRPSESGVPSAPERSSCQIPETPGGSGAQSSWCGDMRGGPGGRPGVQPGERAPDGGGGEAPPVARSRPLPGDGEGVIFHLFRDRSQSVLWQPQLIGPFPNFSWKISGKIKLGAFTPVAFSLQRPTPPPLPGEGGLVR